MLIVIPVHDEAATIGDVVARCRRHGPVLVVDDGSTDGSGALAAAAGATVVRLPRRAGKGAALRRGFGEALARGAERVVTLDGDGQHEPEEIPRLLAAAARDPEAVVIGGRLGEGRGPLAISPGRLNAVLVASFFIDWLAGSAVRDTQSGFRVYPASLLARGAARRGGFVLESELLLCAAAEGRPLVEVPVRARALAGRPSRFRPGRDGMAVGGYLAARALGAWLREGGAVLRALVRPFSPERRRRRHRELLEVTAGAAAAGPAAWATAVGCFAAQRTADTWRRWWQDPRAVRLRVVGLASAATPLLLGALLLQPAARPLGLDLVGPLVRRAFRQDRLARTFAPAAGPAAAAAPRP